MIAQDTTSYGRDLDGETDLALLLRMLDSLDGPRWIRLLYTYPRRFTGKLIDAIGQCARVVPYVDIPLQHISDDILRRMGRGVKRKDIESLLHQLRDRVEGIVLRTTFIVGFPGESESDFDELLQFVRDFRFDAMGVFEFSREEGTPACDFPNQVPGDVKSQRRAALMTAQQEIAFSTGSAMVGKQLEVLVDGVDDEGRCVGRWYGQAPDIDGVCCLTEPGEVGALVSVTVSDRDGYDLIVAPI